MRGPEDSKRGGLHGGCRVAEPHGQQSVLEWGRGGPETRQENHTWRWKGLACLSRPALTVTQPCSHLSVETMSPSKPNTLDYRVLMPRQRQVKGAQRSLLQEGSPSWGPRLVIRQSP